MLIFKKLTVGTSMEMSKEQMEIVE